MVGEGGCKVCPKCSFKADRDVVGAMNIYKRTLAALAPRVGSQGIHPMTDET